MEVELTDEGRTKKNSQAFDSGSSVDGKAGARKGRDDRLVGCVSPEELWKSPLNSVACRIGFLEKGLCWGCTGAAMGWLRLPPFARAWPGAKAEILMGLSSVNSDSVSEPAQEHGWWST